MNKKFIILTAILFIVALGAVLFSYVWKNQKKANLTPTPETNTSQSQVFDAHKLSDSAGIPENMKTDKLYVTLVHGEVKATRTSGADQESEFSYELNPNIVYTSTHLVVNIRLRKIIVDDAPAIGTCVVHEPMILQPESYDETTNTEDRAFQFSIPCTTGKQLKQLKPSDLARRVSFDAVLTFDDGKKSEKMFSATLTGKDLLEKNAETVSFGVDKQKF